MIIQRILSNVKSTTLAQFPRRCSLSTKRVVKSAINVSSRQNVEGETVTCSTLERFKHVPNFVPYPHSFPISMTLKEYRQLYSNLQPKVRCTQDAVDVAGRIVSIRAASKNLIFMDLQSDGITIQVLSELKHYQGSIEGMTTEAIKEEFQRIHESLRRGDIIGI